MINYPYKHSRTPLAVTLSVWKALFLREIITRVSNGRGAAIWLFADPIIKIIIMLLIFTFIRVKVVSGIDVLAWLIIGLTFFAAFVRTSQQVQNAINPNKALFVYRQVKPIDTLLARAFVEGFLAVQVTFIVAAGAIFFLDVDLFPVEPALVLLAFMGLWLMGLGYGLMASVAVELVPELGKILGMLALPLYFTSGAIFPLHNIPQPYLSWVMYNPMAHGLEAARAGISPYYHAVTGTNLMYLYQFALVAIFLGLLLQSRFEEKILTK